MSILISELSNQFLTWVVVYGPPMLSLALFLGALGLPLPGTFFVIAAGAFIRQGVLDGSMTLLLAFGSVILGDLICYGVGRFACTGIEKRFGASPIWQEAKAILHSRGGSAIYLTRWLLTPLAIPVNLITGSSGYPFIKFLCYDAAGELTWLLLFGTLGYAFGSQWEVISDLASDFSGLLLGLVLLGTGIYFIVRKSQDKVPEEKSLAPQQVSGREGATSGIKRRSSISWLLSN
jgi:membrane protein DedA with SNARE-associated domain